MVVESRQNRVDELFRLLLVMVHVVLPLDAFDGVEVLPDFVDGGVVDVEDAGAIGFGGVGLVDPQDYILPGRHRYIISQQITFITEYA